jgi:hypothetical protein
MQPKIRIEMVYAEPRHSIVKSFRLAPGSAVLDALRLAALDPDFSKVDLESSPVGIFGKLMPKDQILADGDRIEIYRRLMQEPKLARRARVSKSGRS